MGTRHLQVVITKEGEKKISQYGQWDGYPDGQGKDILEFLRTGDLDKYQTNLKKIKPISKKQAKIVDEDTEWSENYPHLSRDCGSRIHKMIEEGQIKFVGLMEQEEAYKWCEGFYTIDFFKNLFTSDFHGRVKSYPIDKLPTEKKYLKDMQDKG
jgi:hypothetical protein